MMMMMMMMMMMIYRRHQDCCLHQEAGQLCQERAWVCRWGYQPDCHSLSHNQLLLKIEIFKGDENLISMNQAHSKKLHCTYLLHYYPFDTQVNRILSKIKKELTLLWVCFYQVCLVHFQLEQFARKSVKLEPSTIEMLSPLELTQYYIKVGLTYL